MGTGKILRLGKFTSEDQYPIIKAGLNRIFPQNEGWKHFNRYNWVSYIYNLIIQRENEKGEVQRVLIEINLRGRPDSQSVNEFNAVARKLVNEHSQVIKKIMISTENVISPLPENIDYFTVEEFISQFCEEQKSVMGIISA